MATITVNISNEVAQEFREHVQREQGKKKGVLGKAIESALKHWLYEKRQKQIAQEMTELMEKGVGTLKGWKFNRAELYDRR